MNFIICAVSHILDKTCAENNLQIFKYLTIFAKNSIADIRQGLKFTTPIVSLYKDSPRTYCFQKNVKLST